jgi:hypothetical protein
MDSPVAERTDPRFTETESLKFFDMLADKGVMKTPTARSRKIAVVKVLSVLSPDEKKDLRTIDRQDAITRFVNKFGQDFHPDSLATYAYRFNVGLDDFLAWAENPMGFRPTTAQRSARTARASEEMIKVVKRAEEVDSALPMTPVTGISASIPVAATGLIAIPVPLPSGGIAQLYVPQKLTAADADRIAAMAKALAVGEG